jgi:hypothetical protein
MSKLDDAHHDAARLEMQIARAEDAGDFAEVEKLSEKLFETYDYILRNED